jgi:hypothetical protein
MQSMLATFGEAFGEVETYSENQLDKRKNIKIERS